MVALGDHSWPLTPAIHYALGSDPYDGPKQNYLWLTLGDLCITFDFSYVGLLVWPRVILTKFAGVEHL